MKIDQALLARWGTSAHCVGCEERRGAAEEGETMVCGCGLRVVDGENGTEYPAPPWGGEPAATCYGCENAAEAAADEARQDELVLAAWRAGRGDLA